MTKKLSLRPPTHKSEDDEKREIIAGVSNAPTVKEGNEPKPWDDPKVRKDLMIAVSLRLPEPYVLKIRWLSEKTRISQQEMLREILLPWLDQKIDKD